MVVGKGVKIQNTSVKVSGRHYAKTYTEKVIIKVITVNAKCTTRAPPSKVEGTATKHSDA